MLLSNLQQLRLVSFKLCQDCAARCANAEPFQEPVKPLQTYAVCSQGCAHIVRHLGLHMRDFSLPQTDYFPVPGRNHHSQIESRYEIRIDIHTHTLCVSADPVFGEGQARKRVPTDLTVQKVPHQLIPFLLAGETLPRCSCAITPCSEEREHHVSRTGDNNLTDHQLHGWAQETATPRHEAETGIQRETDSACKWQTSADLSAVCKRGRARDVQRQPRSGIPTEQPTAVRSPALPHRRGAGGQGGAWERRCRRQRFQGGGDASSRRIRRAGS